jgi:hypothetical protein
MKHTRERDVDKSNEMNEVKTRSMTRQRTRSEKDVEFTILSAEGQKIMHQHRKTRNFGGKLNEILES